MSSRSLDPPELPYGSSRLLTIADVPAIYDLYRRCDDYFLLQDGEQASLADAEALFSDVPSPKSADDQVIVGCWQESNLYALAAVLTGYPEADDWYLSFLLLDPSFRRRGLGRRLYSVVEHWALEKGARRMLVAVLMDNKPALQFWERCRFDELRLTGPTKYKNNEHMVKEFSRFLV